MSNLPGPSPYAYISSIPGFKDELEHEDLMWGRASNTVH
jgi:hypothetical protein